MAPLPLVRCLIRLSYQRLRLGTLINERLGGCLIGFCPAAFFFFFFLEMWSLLLLAANNCTCSTTPLIDGVHIRWERR